MGATGNGSASRAWKGEEPLADFVPDNIISSYTISVSFSYDQACLPFRLLSSAVESVMVEAAGLGLVVWLPKGYFEFSPPLRRRGSL